MTNDERQTTDGERAGLNTEHLTPNTEPPTPSAEPHRPHHNVAVAALAAMTLPGAGQIYNGQVAKGVLLLLVCAGLLIALALRIRDRGFVLGAGSAGLLLWALGVVDAGIVAGRIIHGQRVGPWRCF